MPEQEKPIQSEYHAEMNAIAKVLDETFNGTAKRGERKVGFALLVFPFSQPEGEKRANYISNAGREDMLVMMKEFIARSEGRFTEDGSTNASGH